MRRRNVLSLGFVAVLPLGGIGQAQPDDHPSAAYRQVTAACAAEVARLCAPADRASGFARDQVMCLKLFRSDLGLACRHAVDRAIARPSNQTGSGDSVSTPWH